MSASALLAQPLAPESYDPDRCPARNRTCRLVPDGQGSFVCRMCGTGFVPPPGDWQPADWHRPYPWE